MTSLSIGSVKKAQIGFTVWEGAGFEMTGLGSEVSGQHTCEGFVAG
jgi:hypothetical protein